MFISLGIQAFEYSFIAVFVKRKCVYKRNFLVGKIVISNLINTNFNFITIKRILVNPLYFLSFSLSFWIVDTLYYLRNGELYKL